MPVAYNMRIDTPWFLDFQINDDNTITINDHWRYTYSQKRDPEEWEQSGAHRDMPRFRLEEMPGRDRIVHRAQIITTPGNTKWYSVANPQNVFSYDSGKYNVTPEADKE